MKKAMAILTGLAVAVGVSALLGAEERAKPGKPKAKAEGKGRAVVAQPVPEETAASVTDEADELSATLDGETADTRPKIRVLENPYDIASFYRSDSGQGGFFGGEGDGASGSGRYPIAGFYRAEGGQGQGPYAIAGFYRAGGGSGRYPIAGFYRGGQGAYGSFWNSGYGQHRRGRVLVGYRRSIGQNGDLFLIAPFLAPIGPLSEAFNR